MKLKGLLFTFLFITASTGFVSAQCLEIICPSDTTITANVNCEATLNYTEPIGKDICTPTVTYIFTNCSATGQTGPTQTQVNSAYSSTTLSGLVLANAGIQYIEVPQSGSYSIEAIGANGGGVSGGLGASIKGEFNLVAGDTIAIIVGQMGLDPADGTTTAGGGSFVVLVDRTSTTYMTTTGLPVTPLVIAGGGGGNPGVANALSDGSITTSGNAGAGGTGFGNGGSSGNGGSISVSSGNNRGGGGGGFLTDGERTGTCGTGGLESGSAFVNGGNGGLSTSCSTGYPGGFGGGGGGISSGWRSSGGGGGYSGGGAGQTNSVATNHRGGGGGSYNGGTSPVNTAGAGTGQGSVILTLLGNAVTTTQTSGLGTGSTFPLGVTTETYEVTDGVNTTSCSFTITVVDTPTTIILPFTEDTICETSSAVALPPATPVGGTYSGTGVVGNGFDPAVSGLGTFWVTYTDVMGCPQSDSTIITVVDCTVGVESHNGLSRVSIAPNPGKGIFTLQNNGSKVDEIWIYNTVGKLILNQAVTDVNSIIDLTAEPNGIYLLKARSVDQYHTYRLVKN